MQLIGELVLTACVFSTSVSGYQSSHSGETDTSFADAVAPRSSATFKLRTPHFTLSPHPWFDVEKERNHWKEISARLNVYMNSKLESDESHGVDYDAILRKDVAVSNALDKEVQRINAAIQAETPIGGPLRRDSDPGSLSLLETGDGYTESDWTFCTCQTGPNGTLVYPERNWPGVKLPEAPSVDLTKTSLLELRTASMLKLTVRGKRTAVRRSAVCDCANPWETYMDPSGSSVCSLNQKTTICVIKRNVLMGVKSSESLRQEALELLTAIDSMFETVVPEAEKVIIKTLDSVAAEAEIAATTTVEPPVEEVTARLPPAGNYTGDYQPIGSNVTEQSFNTTETTTTTTPGIEDLVQAAATIVPYQNDNGVPPTEAPVKSTPGPGSWEVVKNMTWESASGEPVTDTIVTKVVNESDYSGNISSFAEVWKPFQFSF